MRLHLLLFTLCACLSTTLRAQNCPPGNTGLLSGGQSAIAFTDTLPAPTYTSRPTGLPNTEFLFILQDSQSTDGMGPVVLQTSLTGRAVPNDLGLGLCNNLCVLPFSYDLGAIQMIVDSILYADFFPGTPCCSALSSFAPGICDSLTSQGINQGSDIRDLNDVISFLSIFAGNPDAPSLQGITGALVTINNAINLAGNCAAGIAEICYRVDITGIGQACYYITLPGAASSLTVPYDTFAMVNGITYTLGPATYSPASAMDSIVWSLAAPNSNITLTPDGMISANTAPDSAWVVCQTLRSCIRDTVYVRVDMPVGLGALPTTTPLDLVVTPQPFGDFLTVDLATTQPTEGRLQLLQTTGQVLLERDYRLLQGQQRVQLHTATLPAGCYLLRWTDALGQKSQVVIKH